jgi:hypothetical protein
MGISVPRSPLARSHSPGDSLYYSAITPTIGPAVSMQSWQEQVTNDVWRCPVSTAYGYTLTVGTAAQRASWPDLNSITRRIYTAASEYLYSYSGQT